MKIYLIITLSAVLMLGCASSKKTSETSVEADVSSAYDESFDPLTLKDNDVVIQKKTTASEIKEDAKPAKQEVIVMESPDKGEADGFRVQLVATKNIESATMTQQTAADQFRSMNYKSYLVFESPQYKVRIGDVLTKEEAEKIRDIAKDFGYTGAFIVRSKVNTKK